MLELDHVEKTFTKAGRRNEKISAVRDVSLCVEKGEFIALLGPSGSGKSTILRCAAGLEIPSSGRILVGDKCVFDSRTGTYVSPGKRNIGVVFQSYAIWPHMTVAENVIFPLEGGHSGERNRRLNRKEKEDRVTQVLGVVGLEEFADRRAGALSGGQQQRVAFARAVIGEPRVLLLDEPLSNLDLKLRERLRLELRRLQRELGITTVYVTHDQTDALSLADRVVVINNGQVAQVGSPQEIYERPNGYFVADFVGNGNFIKGTMELRFSESCAALVKTEIGIMKCGWESPAIQLGTGFEVLVFVRPENVSLGVCDHIQDPDNSQYFRDNELVGVVVDKMYFGETVDYFVDLGREVIIRARHQEISGVEIGSRVKLGWPSAVAGVLPSS